nr:hypothetical protein [Tanacetum cinerariifolium]
MASEHRSLEPALHEMTPVTISSGLVPNPPPSTPYIPPLRNDWDIFCQSLFDELLNPPPSVDLPSPQVIAPIAKVVALEPAASTGSPSLTTVNQEKHHIIPLKFKGGIKMFLMWLAIISDSNSVIILKESISKRKLDLSTRIYSRAWFTL